jgi:small-conductance mechanosensitive channel
VAKVRARARPWRSIIALVLALCSLAGAEFARHTVILDQGTSEALNYGGSAAFFLFGGAASFGLSGQARNLLQPVIGAAHAGVTRYALALVGIFTVLVIALHVANVPVGQLVLGGAVTGVLLGIAAQQSLSNLFAGMVLLFARPFRVGDRVRFRAGALSGLLEGTVIDISITYVHLETADGVIFVPNSQALAAAVGPIPASSPAAATGTPPPGVAGTPPSAAPAPPNLPAPPAPAPPAAAPPAAAPPAEQR